MTHSHQGGSCVSVSDENQETSVHIFIGRGTIYFMVLTIGHGIDEMKHNLFMPLTFGSNILSSKKLIFRVMEVHFSSSSLWKDKVSKKLRKRTL